MSKIKDLLIDTMNNSNDDYIDEEYFYQKNKELFINNILDETKDINPLNLMEENKSLSLAFDY